MPDFLQTLQNIQGVPKDEQRSTASITEAVSSSTPTLDGYRATASMDMGLTFPDQIVNPLDQNYQRIMEARKVGNQQYLQNANSVYDQTMLENAGDAVVSAGHGFARSFTDLATALAGIPLDLAAKAVGSDAQPSVAIGNALSGSVDSIADALHSDEYLARQQALSAQREAQFRDSEAQYNRDLSNGDSVLKATGKQILRDISNYSDRTSTYDAVMTGAEVTGQVAGQALMAGMGSAALANKANKIKSEGIKKFLSKVKNPAIIGGTEAASNLVGTAQEVMETSYEDLMRNSPVFPSLVQENLDKGMNINEAQEAAKTTLAGMVSRRNFLYTLPTAVAAGKLASSGIERPFSAITRPIGDTAKIGVLPAARRAIANRLDLAGIAGEAAEETLQGISGTLASQYITQELVNRNQRVGQGIGDVIAESAYGGAIGRGSMTLPRTTLGAPIDLAVGIVSDIKAGAQAAAQTRAGKATADTISNATSSVFEGVGDIAEKFNLKRNEKKINEIFQQTNTTLKDLKANNSKTADEILSFKDDKDRAKYTQNFNKYFKDYKDSDVEDKGDALSYNWGVYLNGSKEDKITAANNIRELLEEFTSEDNWNTLKNQNADYKQAVESWEENIRKSTEFQDVLNAIKNTQNRVLKEAVKDSKTLNSLSKINAVNSAIADSNISAEQKNNLISHMLGSLDTMSKAYDEINKKFDPDKDTIDLDELKSNKPENLSEEDWNSLLSSTAPVSNTITKQDIQELKQSVDTQRKAIKSYRDRIAMFESLRQSGALNDTLGRVTDNQFVTTDGTKYSAKDITDNLNRISLSNAYRNKNKRAINEYNSWLDRLYRIAKLQNNKAKTILKSYKNYKKTGETVDYKYQTFDSTKGEEFWRKIGYNPSGKGKQLFRQVIADQQHFIDLYNLFVEENSQYTGSYKPFSAKEIVNIPKDLETSSTSGSKQETKQEPVKEETKKEPEKKDIVTKEESISEPEKEENLAKEAQEVIHDKALRFTEIATKATEQGRESLTDEEKKEFISLRDEIKASKDLPESIKQSILSGEAAVFVEDSSSSGSKDIRDNSYNKAILSLNNKIFKAGKYFNNYWTFWSEDSGEKIIRNIFDNYVNISDLSEKEKDRIKHAFSIKRYQDFKNQLEKRIMGSLTTQGFTLNNFFSKLNDLKTDEEKQAYIEQSITKWADAKILQFTYLDDKGLHVSDRHAAIAYLAAIQFSNEITAYAGGDQITADLDSDGIDISTLTQEDINDLTKGAPVSTIIPALTNKLMSYFGVTGSNDVSNSYNARAVMSSLAMESLLALSDDSMPISREVKATKQKRYTTGGLGLFKISEINLTTWEEDINTGNSIRKDTPIKVISLVDNNSLKDISNEADSALNNLDELIDSQDYEDTPKSSSPTIVRETRLFNNTKKFLDKLIIPGSNTEYFMNQEMPDINQTHKLRTNTPISDKERTFLSHLREIKYYANEEFLEVLQHLKSDGLINLFSEVTSNPIDGEETLVWNNKDLASKEGKNLTLVRSLLVNANRYYELHSYWRDLPPEERTEDPYLRFDYTLTRAERAQELAAYGPQADKLSRQLFTNVHSELDYNNANDAFGFYCALIQAFDGKVKHYTLEQIDDVGKAIIDTVAKSDFITKKDYSVESIQKVFKDVSLLTSGDSPKMDSKVSFLGINALTNIAKLLDSSNGKFINTLSFELDASTAGTTNSIAKFSSGKVTLGELLAMARGGFHFGKITNNLDFFKNTAEGKQDNYTNAAELANENIKINLQDLSNLVIKGVPVGTNVAENVLFLAGLFTNGVKYNEAGLANTNDIGKIVDIARSAIKKPATSINYYQQLNSATNNHFVNNVFKSIYQHMSAALQADASFDSIGQKFFSKEILAGTMTPKQADINYDRFLSAIDNLTKGSVILTHDGYKFFGNKPKDFINQYFSSTKGWDTFDFNTIFSGSENAPYLKSIQDNFKNVLVRPIYEGICENRGTGFENTASLIVGTTSLMGTTLNSLVRKYVSNYTKEHKELPSNKQINDYIKSIRWAEPVIRFGSAYMDMSKQTVYDEGSDYSRVRSLEEELNFNNSLYIPANPGVSAVALSVIGTTDGAMQVDFFNNDKSIWNQVADRYDGIDIDPKNIKKISEYINKSALEAIKDNPLKGYVSKFRKYIETLKAISEENGEPESQFLLEQEYLDKTNIWTTILNNVPDTYQFNLDSNRSDKVILEGLEAMRQHLEDTSKIINARIKVFQSLPASIHHMSSTIYGYDINTDTKMAKELEQYLADHANEPNAEKSSYQYQLIADFIESKVQQELAVSKKKAEGKDRDSRLKSLGINKLYGKGITNSINRALNNVKEKNPELYRFYKEILLKNGTKGLTIYTGSSASFLEANRNNEFNAISDKDITGSAKGICNSTTGEIYIFTDRTKDSFSETLLHETVHYFLDSRIEAIANAVNSGQPVTSTQEALYKQNIDLLDQFLAVDTESIKNPFVRNVQQYLKTLREFNPSEAMREFYAYALSNNGLNKYLQGKEAKLNRKTRKSFLELVNTLPDIPKVFKKLCNSVYRFVSSLLGIQVTSSNLRMLTALELGATSLVHVDDNFVQRNLSVAHSMSHYLSMDKDENVKALIQKLKDKMLFKIEHTNYSRNQEENTFYRNLEKANLESEISTVFSDEILEGQKLGFFETASQVALAKVIMVAFDAAYMGNSALHIEAENLRQYCLHKISMEDFLDSHDKGNPIEEAKANDKYVFLANKNTKLSTFMAVALTDPKLREILANIPVTRKDLIQASDADTSFVNSSWDKVLADLGDRTIDTLSSFLSGRANTKNARDIIDSYIIKMSSLDRELSLLNIPTTFVTASEDKISDLADRLGESFITSKLLNSYVNSKEGHKFRAGLASVLQFSGSSLNQNIFKNNMQKIQDYINSYAAQNPSWWSEFLMWANRELNINDEDNNVVMQKIKQTKSAIQNLRQNKREYVPKIIKDKFRKELKNKRENLTRKECSVLNRAINKCDLGALDIADAKKVLSSDNNLTSEIDSLKNQIEQGFTNKERTATALNKSNQLADYMLTGNTGNRLLRNARAIALGLSVNHQGKLKVSLDEMTDMIDRYVTLLALSKLTKEERAKIKELFDMAPNSMEYTIAQQKALRTKEKTDAENNSLTRYNYYKGYIPYSNLNGASVRLVSAEDVVKYKQMGYKEIGKYKGPHNSNLRPMYYMTNSFNPKMTFSQGLLQSVVNMAGGVNTSTGYSTSGVVMTISNPHSVGQYAATLYKDTGINENMMPVFDENGDIVALELSANPEMYSTIRQEEDFAQVLGNWWGRQVEEDGASAFNTQSIKLLKEIWDKAKKSKDYIKQFVNVEELAERNPVVKDALMTLSPEVRQQISEVFGKEGFWVRRDMLDDVIGHRRASITDSFTGKTTWSPEAQRAIVQTARLVLGKDAFNKLNKGERALMFAVSSARNWIVVRSGVVPLQNLISNIFQLYVRGISPFEILREVPILLREVEGYNSYRMRRAELEADLNAIEGNHPNDIAKKTAIENQIKGLEASLEHYSLKDLFDAGEYNTIADIGDTFDDLLLSTGRWGEYLDRQVNKLPKSMVNMGRYLLITKDTALYKGLEKSVQYGDFLAKGILYKHLRKQGTSKKEALDIVRYEFVNYDMLPSRSREYLENIGLLWFYNYKLRTVRVMLSMLRNNPLHALFYMAMPLPNDIGSPITDNLLSKMMSGGFTYTMGPMMGLTFFRNNLWLNIFN